MSSIRFVHAADLHLDSPFRGIHNEAPEHVAKRLVEATFGAYERIIDLCIERDAEALLVAGDIYDGADRSLRAQLRFVEGLRKLDARGIRSFVCHGNHDPLDGWQARLAFPESCYQFPETVTAVPFDPNNPERATVLGVSYQNRKEVRNLVPAFGPIKKQGYAIGLLHCNAGNNPDHDPYAPCTLDDLRMVGIDYWALGHVHTRQVLSEYAPTVVYPGNSQGRNPRETGPRGVYVVEANPGLEPRLEFADTSVIRWECVQVDIGLLETEQALVDVVMQAIETMASGAERDVVARVTLVGRGDLHSSLRQPEFLGDLHEQINQTWAHRRPFVWCERIEDDTSPALDREALIQGNDFVADLLKLYERLREDPIGQSLIKLELNELYGNGRIRAALEDRSLSPMEELLAGAEQVSLDALL